MLSNEQVRIRELPSLIEALCEHLKKSGYSEYTIRRVRKTLKRFCSFADENSIEVYDSFAAQSFIAFSYGDDYQDKYYSYSVTRPLGMLNDYLRFGTVLRQKYSSETFTDEFKPLFQSFLNYLECRNYAERSVKICRSHLLRFQHFLLNNNIRTLDKLSSDAVKNYCFSLASYSTTASCQTIRELHHLFTYAKINDYLTDDLSVGLPHIKNTRAQRLPDIFTPQEINKILDVIDRDNPFPEDVGWAIIDYIKNARPDSASDYVFVGFNPPYDQLTIHGNLIAKYMREAGLYSNEKRRAGMHTFRRSLATSMLENDIPVPVIAQTLGHSDLNSVGSYIRISIKLLKKCAMEVNEFE